MVALSWVLLSALAGAVHAGTVVWSGSFNPYATVADFDKCKSLGVRCRWLPTHRRPQGHGPIKLAPTNGYAAAQFSQKMHRV